MDAVCRPTVPRRLTGTLVLGVCGLLLLRCFLIEPYEVPTGSMAPAIFGRHRTSRCPRCGCVVTVGRDPAEGKRKHSPADRYGRACCPNCGYDRLALGKAPEADGDQLLVNKTVFAFRRPRRWEIIVFRLFGKTFIKRVIGLPGELIEILGGDVYINGELARKTLAEFKAMRILVFDSDYQPGRDGWLLRWEAPADQSGPHPLTGAELHLDGSAQPGACRFVSYRNYLLDERQCRPICDECSYNGAEARTATPVHDFMFEGDIEVQTGDGNLLLSLTDGADTVVAEIPAGAAGGPRPLRLRTLAGGGFPTEPAAPVGKDFLASAAGSKADLTAPVGKDFLASAAGSKADLVEPLRPGRSYHVEMALVDRRLTLALDGRSLLPPVDLPAVRERGSVVRPVTLGVRGVAVVVRHFRLYRDVHYAQAGRNAVGGKVVRLGGDQYFVLGDNSPNSDDSRFWPDGGAVPADCLIGKPFLVHLPTQVVTWELFGRRWQSRLPDWARIRWLR
jgi:signal peptidase I